MDIAHMQDWTGARRNPALTRAAHARVSVRIAGSRTVAAVSDPDGGVTGATDTLGNSELCDVSSG